MIVDIRGDKVRVGITAEPHVSVTRSEIKHAAVHTVREMPVILNSLGTRVDADYRGVKDAFLALSYVLVASQRRIEAGLAHLECPRISGWLGRPGGLKGRALDNMLEALHKTVGGDECLARWRALSNVEEVAGFWKPVVASMQTPVSLVGAA